MSGRIEVVVADREQAGAEAARRILDRARRGGLRRLGVATGGSAEPVYAALRADADAVALLRETTAYALDEYAGLAADHPDSYRATLMRQYASPMGLSPDRLRVPDGSAADLEAEAARYDAEIAAHGGVDLQILGIGGNGHIAFNEPGAPLDGRTHVQMLSESTRADNARFFESQDEVPTHAITQGIGTIMSADEIVMLAFGAGKAAAVRDALRGPVTPAVPASALQRHARVTLIADGDALALL